MTPAKKGTGDRRGVADAPKGTTQRAVEKTVSNKTVTKAAAKPAGGTAAKSGRTVSKSAHRGHYKIIQPKVRKAGESKMPGRPSAFVKYKTGQRPSSADASKSGRSAWQKKVTAGAIATTAKSKRDAQSTGQPVELPRDVQEFLEAFVAELDTTLVPAIVQRLRAGAALLSPKELARRMLAVAPAPAPANKMAEQVGPEFYETAGVAVVLAQPGSDPISKQAVEHRRKRRSVLALQTSDGRWIYPTWQFREHDVMPGLAEVLAVFDKHPSWSVATWLTTPTGDLEGRTAVQWLDEGRDRDRLLLVARRTAHRWAA